jgi:hypothetical protein
VRCSSPFPSELPDSSSKYSKIWYRADWGAVLSRTVDQVSPGGDSGERRLRCFLAHTVSCGMRLRCWTTYLTMCHQKQRRKWRGTFTLP